MNSEAKKKFPSEEMPWLNLYAKGAREAALKPVEEITMWRYLERYLKADGDKIPALKYFGRTVKRSELIKQVYRWARTLKGMGIEADERVIIYIPFIPEAAYILFALNIIGAWPVMLNMGSSPEALKAGSEGARFGIIADAVEDKMAHVFRNSRQFKAVLFLSITDQMGLPMKAVARLKVSSKNRKILKENRHYISASDALKRWSGYKGEIEAAYDPQRPAIVTSSGGTSQKGYAKQIMDTNRAVISMYEQVLWTPLRERYIPGGTVYTGLPPFISTCIFCLFYGPLAHNMTCQIEPRFDSKIFTKNILKYRPQICLAPGRCWIYFFTQIERMLKKGKKVDFSQFTMPIMGGDGCVPEDLRWMNSVLRKCNSPVQIASGYGMSEVFSILTCDCRDGYESDNDTEDVITVGAPVPGGVVSIQDANGNELGYHERGEICVKTTTMMRGYYNNEELTASVMRGGWYHSGDLGSIDEKGFVYIYSRMSDAFFLEDGTPYYPVDLELRMTKDKEVHNTLVLNMAGKGEKPKLAAHIVLYHDCKDKEAVIRRLDASVQDILPEGIRIEGYKIHRHILRMSNVCKTDINSYRAEHTGYCRPEGDRMVEVNFE